MDINNMIKNLDKNKMSKMLDSLSGVISEEEMRAVRGAINDLNSAEVKQNLAKISSDDIKRVTDASPQLKSMMTGGKTGQNAKNK